MVRRSLLLLNVVSRARIPWSVHRQAAASPKTLNIGSLRVTGDDEGHFESMSFQCLHGAQATTIPQEFHKPSTEINDHGYDKQSPN